MKKVHHPLYGKGIIFSQRDNYFYVKFYEFAEMKWVPVDELNLL
jgi:hypothetical protein